MVPSSCAFLLFSPLRDKLIAVGVIRVDRADLLYEARTRKVIGTFGVDKLEEPIVNTDPIHICRVNFGEH